MKLSKSPITGKEYKIPSEIDDSKSIREFLKKNKDKKVVVVQGLGFVGAVMSLVCANSISDEYAVIGVDLPSENSLWKIKSINEGIFPLIADDPKIYNFFNEAKLKGNFLATYDTQAYNFADTVIIDINLDVEKKSNSRDELTDFDVSMDSFAKAVSEIGKNCKEEVLIIVETTVPPGTCKKLVKPIIEEELARRGLQNNKYKLGHSYERVMPGPNYINSIREYPRVYSGIDSQSADATEAFLKTIINTSICNLTRLNNTNETEIAKVLENSYRAMNISFIVEWSRFAEEADANLYSIVNAIRERETHSNLMYPGIGVGGYCLTKDPLLASWSQKAHFDSKNDLNMSINSVSINDQMPKFAYRRMIEVFGNFEDKNILFLGISYRGDVGDTRFTPVSSLYDYVKAVTKNISLHDPYLNFWEEQNAEVDQDIDTVLSNAQDLIIISTGHSLYGKDETIDKLMKIQSTNIYDTIGIFNNDQIAKLSQKHNLSVLGRGDI